MSFGATAQTPPQVGMRASSFAAPPCHAVHWGTTPRAACRRVCTFAASSRFMCGAPAAQDGKGNTPLHFAAGYARGALARRLVEAGANGAVENGDGNTPLELVTCATCPVMRSHGADTEQT